MTVAHDVQPAKRLLYERGYTVAGIARRLRLSRRHVADVLNGEVRPSHEVRVGLCNLLDRPVTELFTCGALAGLYRAGPGRRALPTAR